jgi:hypothetical protein
MERYRALALLEVTIADRWLPRSDGVRITESATPGIHADRGRRFIGECVAANPERS